MSDQQKDSTLAALLKEKRHRGRPPSEITRQNVYVELTDSQKQQLTEIAEALPEGFVRADTADLAIIVLATRLESLRRAVAGRTREIPEGITDLESLFLLWDLPLYGAGEEARWTSIRLSPQQAIELGRAHGTLNVLFGATRSEVFSLALALLVHMVEYDLPEEVSPTIVALRELVADIYL